MMTDDEIEELIKVATLVGTRSYAEIVPVILAEILRLRRDLRSIAIERATDAASRP
jgi:hypothetical protein